MIGDKTKCEYHPDSNVRKVKVAVYEDLEESNGTKRRDGTDSKEDYKM